MKTETTAFMGDSKESVKHQNETIDKFFSELEKENFTIQEVKNIVSRINVRVESASITNDIRTPFKKDLTD